VTKEIGLGLAMVLVLQSGVVLWNTILSRSSS